MSEPEALSATAVAKFYHAICVLEEFDCKEFRGVVKGMLSLTDREKCYVATYYRAALNVHSLVFLNDPKHFQAIAQLARALFELAVDMRLVGNVDRACEKMFAFSDVECLKSAREVVSIRGDDCETGLAEQYIQDHEGRIAERKDELWPDAGRLPRLQTDRTGHGRSLLLRHPVSLLGAEEPTRTPTASFASTYPNAPR